jgi:HK97 family phage portal protein
MPKVSKRTSTKQLSKSIADVNWGGTGSTATMTVEGIKAIVNNLSPSECYQLSIDVRSAITPIATNASKAKLSIFDRKSGREITGGDLYDLLKRPAPYWSTPSFVQENVSHFCLAGEMAVSVLMRGNSEVSGMVPLNPFRLSLNEPTVPNERSEIVSWRYVWPNGKVSIIPADQVLFEKNFNPLSQVRGSPPILSGVQEVSASYQAIRYNSLFFQNNCLPNHILVLPAGISAKDKEAFKEQYVGMHSTYRGSAHKVMVVEGGEGLEVLPLEQTVKGGQFLDLQRLSTERIMRLYKVPPVIGGMWDAAKFDSVDAQRETFAEETLMPVMELFSQMLQSQLVDPHFKGSRIERANDKPVLRKYMKGLYERAMDERSDSDIVVLLDPDTLPIISKIKQGRVGYAKELQETFKITPLRAAEECGFDFEANEANELVWHTTTELPFTPPQKQEPEEQAAEQPAEPADEPDDEQAKSQAENYHKFFRSFRKLALSKLDNNKLFLLADADALNTTKDGVIHDQIRHDHHQLNRIYKLEQDAEKRKSLVRSFFNKHDRKFCRKLAGGEYVSSN